MTTEEFDQVDWVTGLKVKYVGDYSPLGSGTYIIRSVNFTEKLLELDTLIGDEWVRCENVELVKEPS